MLQCRALALAQNNSLGKTLSVELVPPKLGRHLTYMEKMAFSVIPSSAVAQAKTKMRSPKKTCTGM